MTEEIIIDYKKECSNLLAEKNALLCRYEEIREQLKQAENTVNKCHKYLAELENKIESLEQERDELKKTVENQKLEYEELQCDLSEVENACGCHQSENAKLKQENKELKDNNNQLQVIIDDGRAENKRFREENKELESQRDEARIAYNNLILDIVSDIPFEGEIGGERFISIKDRLHQMQKALASLEEIREIVTSAFAKQRPYKEDFAEIETKINEVLNLS